MYIIKNGSFYDIDSDGRISYTTEGGFKVNPSDSWKVLGAVEYKTVFGREVEYRRYSLNDIKENKVPWKFKNGNQRCHLIDYDHGACRVWGTPHYVQV